MDKKVLKYEFKRIVFSKMFIVTFIIALIFSAVDFYASIIRGVSVTAPFSQWSYCKFLCDINSILLLIVMFFCTDFFSKQEERVQEITLFTPMPFKKIWVSKSIAIFISYSIVALSCILLSLFFYKLTLDYTDFQKFLIPIIVILLPTFVFVFGISIYLGNKSQTLLYIAIPIIIMLSLLSFDVIPFLDIFAKGYITNAPKIAELDSLGEPIFNLSLTFIMSRILFLLLGIVLILFKRPKKVSK